MNKIHSKQFADDSSRDKIRKNKKKQNFFETNVVKDN